MAATGNITEDLMAIHEIQSGLEHPTNCGRETWWGSPVDEADIQVLVDEHGELPQDVIDFYRVTDTATFGHFVEIVCPVPITDDLREAADWLFGESAREDHPFDFETGLPRGNSILVMSGHSDWGCLIEIGGPDHGRVINPPHGGNYFRTLAWSLSDAVACTRDLYEFGWFQWEGSWAGDQMSEAGLAELEKVKPIIEKWNCNPVIASFHDPYGYEPERPTKQEM